MSAIRVVDCGKPGNPPRCAIIVAMLNSAGAVVEVTENGWIVSVPEGVDLKSLLLEKYPIWQSDQDWGAGRPAVLNQDLQEILSSVCPDL